MFGVEEIKAIKKHNFDSQVIGAWVEEEAILLLHILRELLPKDNPLDACEIGSYQGGSMALWFILMQHGGKLTSVHPVDIPEHQKQHLKQETMKRCINWEHMVSQSQDAIQQVNFRHINGLDLLFIDGDHTYTGAKLDFDLYFPLMKKGGCIVFHDIHMTHGAKNNSFGYDTCARLWNEIHLSGQYHTLDLNRGYKNPIGYGRCGGCYGIVFDCNQE